MNAFPWQWGTAVFNDKAHLRRTLRFHFNAGRIKAVRKCIQDARLAQVISADEHNTIKKEFHLD